MTFKEYKGAKGTSASLLKDNCVYTLRCVSVVIGEWRSVRSLRAGTVDVESEVAEGAANEGDGNLAR